MKIILLAVGIIFSSATSFATTEDEFIPPMRYAIMPMAGIQLAGTELGGSNSIDPVGFIGVGFRLLRDGFFFTPAAKVGVGNFSVGTASYWSVGFIAGGHVDFFGFDVFAGADYQTFMSFTGPNTALQVSGLVDGTPLYKLGALVNLGASGIQLQLDAFYAQFTQHVATSDGKLINFFYPYLGGEVSLQLPIGL